VDDMLATAHFSHIDIEPMLDWTTVRVGPERDGRWWRRGLCAKMAVAEPGY
jgi:hypothetical protein